MVRGGEPDNGVDLAGVAEPGILLVPNVLPKRPQLLPVDKTPSAHGGRHNFVSTRTLMATLASGEPVAFWVQ